MMTPLARSAGPIALAAGALIVGTRIVTMLTIPPVLGEPLKAAALTPVFAINSIASIVAFALLALALVAIYEWQAQAAGRFGAVAVGAAMIGTIAMAGDWWYEAFAVPWLADVAPIVFDTGAGGRLLLGGLGSFALFALGWALFGIATVRAGIFPRWLSITILVTGILSGIPIAGAYLYGSVGFGLAIAGLGGWLMKPVAVRHEIGRVAAA